jgi:transcriptional regulator with XRE-family HTH domain
MITAIREVRRAKGLTLEDVARRCVPSTTAQTIGRLETGTRTVSVGWLNRIAVALGVAASDLVTLPDRVDLPVAAILDARGAHAPRRATAVPPPQVAPGQIAVTVAGGIGDNRAGRFAFGRLMAHEGGVTILPPGAGTQSLTIEDPAWIALAVRLVRDL